MEFRSFEEQDAGAIEQLFGQTFTESANEAEARLVSQLVRELMTEADRADWLGFVAWNSGDVVGAIFFSRLRFDDSSVVYLLSPVAVATSFQRQGIGSRLIRFGLEELRRQNVDFVVTYGDPEFYGRLGFQPISTDSFEPPYQLSQPQGWIGQTISGPKIESLPGKSRCVPPFEKPELW